MKHPDGGSRRKCGGGVTGGERSRVGERDHRLDRRISDGRPGALGDVLQRYGYALGDRRRRGGGECGRRQSAPQGVATAAGDREERPLDPPGRRNHEDNRERRPVNSMQQLEQRGIYPGQLTQKLGQGSTP
jgi:hypothetical protein